MRPFIWYGHYGHWHVGIRDNPFYIWPGTSWEGYPTLGEAIDATLASLVEPS